MPCIGLSVAPLALLAACYGAWLTAKVAGQPSEGSNIGAGFAGVGTVVAVGTLVLALEASVGKSHNPVRLRQLVTIAVVLLLLAIGSMALPTACLIDPNCT